MEQRWIRPEDFTTTTWQGGSTTELYIYPEGENFRDRHFLFRLSSADFTSTTSTFSDFTGYERYLMPLKGTLWVEHRVDGEPLYRRDLAPYEREFFFGSWKTQSGNSLDCRDFNFIVQAGTRHALEVLRAGESYPAHKQGRLMLFSLGTCLVAISGEELTLPPKHLLVLEETPALAAVTCLEGEAPLVVCEFQGD